MNLEVFNYGGKEVRTQVINGDVWFCLKDVCNVLGIKNPTDVLKRLENDEVTRFNLGGLQGMTNFTNESGLYSVILRSDKPEAKKFKKWITSEVLPSIRKHGMYITDEKLKDLESQINELQNKNPVSRLINEIKKTDINLVCAELQSSVRESANSVTTTTTVRLYPKREVINKPLSLFNI